MRLLFIITIALSYALDSLRDSYMFGGREAVRIVSRRNWHVIKNSSIVLAFASGWIAAIYVMSDIYGIEIPSEIHLVGVFLLVMVSPLLLQIWEAVYSYAVYGKPFRDREAFHIVEWRFRMTGLSLWIFRVGCIGAFVALLYLEGRIF